MIIRELVAEEAISLANIDISVNPSAWSTENYLDAIKNENQCILGIFNEQNLLIGGVSYSCVLDEAEILQVCISSNQQRNGYASQLFGHLFDMLIDSGVTQVFLEVRCNNTPAINLYHKLGFNIIAERKNYYKINGKLFDALIMAKSV